MVVNRSEFLLTIQNWLSLAFSRIW